MVISASRIVLLASILAPWIDLSVAPSPCCGQAVQRQPGDNLGKKNAAERPQELFAADSSMKIKSLLPAGWSLKREKNIVTVKRDKSIEYYCMVGLPTPNLAYLKAHGFIHSETYTITLEFFPPMSKAAVDELVEENRHIEEQYWHEHPLPWTAKSRRLPPEVQNSLHHIPDILTKQYSVLVTPSINGWLAFYSEQDKKECEGVEQVLRRLLKAEEIRNEGRGPG